MRTKLTVAFAVLAVGAIAPAEARDDKHMFQIKDALGKSQQYKEKLESDIALYFGKQKTPAVEKRIGEYTSNKKTNSFNKSDQEACDIAFISAAAALQDRARREGGNAVINIHSVYRNDNISSDTEYLCGSGAMVAGVALRGTVVTVAKGKK
jgi:uncharacterized protein YbjQ (UPF0145 family)